MGKPHIVTIIQARMGSSRFSGKPLKEILNYPLLYYVVERSKKSTLTNQVVVATTTSSQDDCIANWCQENGVLFVRGSEEDVLSRYLLAAKQFQADLIIRITADCPLVDPEVIDKLISYFLSHPDQFDYVSNVFVRTFPRGLDVELFTRKALEIANQEAKLPQEREHVTLYIVSHPERFKLGYITHSEDLSDYRLTVDTPEDFKLIQLIIEALYPKNPDFKLHDMITLLSSHSDWKKINAWIVQKKV